MRKFLGLVLLLVAEVSFAQLYLEPKLGIQLLKNKAVFESQEIYALNNVPTYFAGVGLKYKTNKSVFELAFHPLGIATVVNYKVSDSQVSSIGVSSPMYQYSLNYYRKVFQVVLFPKKAKKGKDGLNHKEQLHYLVFDVLPFVGLSVNKVSLGKYFEPDYQYYKDFGVEGSSDSLRFDTRNVISNRYAFSAQAGCKLQFKNKNRDRLALTFVYHLGFKDQLRVNWEYSKFNSNEVSKNTIVSKGSYVALFASYPISLMSKKRR